MIPTTTPLIIYQGSTFSKLLMISVAGAPYNITGNTFRMQIRESRTKPIIIELTTENGRISVNGAAGEVTLLISATDTAALSFSTALYDLEMISGSVVSRLIEGGVTLSREVTQ